MEMLTGIYDLEKKKDKIIRLEVFIYYKKKLRKYLSVQIIFKEVS